MENIDKLLQELPTYCEIVYGDWSAGQPYWGVMWWDPREAKRKSGRFFFSQNGISEAIKECIEYIKKEGLL